MQENSDNSSQLHPLVRKVIDVLGEGFISKRIESYFNEHDALVESLLQFQHSKLVTSLMEWNTKNDTQTTVNFIKNKVNGVRKQSQPHLSDLLDKQTEENNIVVLCGGIFSPIDIIQYLPPRIGANRYFQNILLGLKDKHEIRKSSLTIIRHASSQDAVDALQSKANVIVFAGHGDWKTWVAAGRQFFTEENIQELNLPQEKRNKIIIRNTCAFDKGGQQLGSSASDNGGKIYGWYGRGTSPREMIADPLHENL